MEALCRGHVSCCSAGLGHVRQPLSVGSAAKSHPARSCTAAGSVGWKSQTRHSIAVRAEPERKGTAIERAMSMAYAALHDPEVQKYMDEDMPKGLGSREMLQEMLEDPEIEELMGENLKNLNTTLEDGMFESIRKRVLDQRPERFEDFNFAALYKEAGVDRSGLLAYLRKMTQDPEMVEILAKPRIMGAIQEIMLSDDESLKDKYEGDLEVGLAVRHVMWLLDNDETIRNL